MNLVLDEAEEMSIKKKSRKPLGELLAEHSMRALRSLTTLRGAMAGRILLKGDNITLMMNAAPPVA